MNNIWERLYFCGACNKFRQLAIHIELPDMSIHSDLDVNILIVIHMILNGSTKHQRKRKKHKLKKNLFCDLKFASWIKLLSKLQ
jgi:hypothetical protein